MNKIGKFYAFILLMFFSAIASAHPPKDIKISINPKAKVLTAVIVHDVLTSPKNHYIKTVEVAINGTKILTHTLSEQENPQTETVSYRLPDAKPGDKISVTGHCSLFGELTKEINYPAG